MKNKNIEGDDVVNNASNETKSEKESTQDLEFDANNLELNDNTEEDSILKKVEETEAKYLRMAADYENAKRRHKKELEEAYDYAITNFVKDLIMVMDNLSRAMDNVPDSTDERTINFVKGVEMTKTELMNVFAKNKIEDIMPNIGDRFDYNLHYAVSHVQTDQFPNNSVMELMQIGYKIRERLIRPAIVSVSKTL